MNIGILPALIGMTHCSEVENAGREWAGVGLSGSHTAARGRRIGQLSSFASSVMVAFSTFDTGQPVFALATALSNSA